jgi:lipopolysaccharide/colanic/teichoic acid biosynthesis glycosyltransferase
VSILDTFHVSAGPRTDRLVLRRPQPVPEGRSPAEPAAWVPAVRRCVDVVGALLVLVLGSPLLLLITVWIRCDSSGPALYRQQRVGKDRVPFTMYKFRSMRMGGDDTAHRSLIAAELRGEDTARDGSTKVADDGRITVPGRLLRRTSLDELPQLLNVLRGDMSLVGPRPCLDWEAEMFPVEYAARFSVRPGLTGLWQVSGRSTLGTLDMLRMDADYLDRRCLAADLAILARTIPSLLRGDGAR